MNFFTQEIRKTIMVNKLRLQINKNGKLFSSNILVCDCNYGFIYHPKTDRCYKAYKQGPCPNNHYLMIRPNQYVPECLPNPCVTDGFVSYKNNCYLLNSVEPCELPELAYHLSVNTTSLELGCFPQNVDMRFDVEYGEGCYPGTKRSILGKCEN